MNLRKRWSAMLEQARSQGRFRELSAPCGIDFSSNDYLGYARRQSEAPAGDLPRSGSASRLAGGHHRVWEEVEQVLARWHGAEAALMMNSGYAANEGLLATIIDPGDWVASDECNHASI